MTIFFRGLYNVCQFQGINCTLLLAIKKVQNHSEQYRHTIVVCFNCILRGHSKWTQKLSYEKNITRVPILKVLRKNVNYLRSLTSKFSWLSIWILSQSLTLKMTTNLDIISKLDVEIFMTMNLDTISKLDVKIFMTMHLDIGKKNNRLLTLLYVFSGTKCLLCPSAFAKLH